MIDIVFNAGNPKHPDSIAYIGSDIRQELRLGFILFVIAVICIPIMLFIKPVFFRGDPPPDENQPQDRNNNNDRPENDEQEALMDKDKEGADDKIDNRKK